jgi:hypothetical protein
VQAAELAFRLADRYWTLSNTVTGVALAQMLFFLYACGQSEPFLTSVRREWRLVHRAIWASGVAYSVILAALLCLELVAVHDISGLSQAIPHAWLAGCVRFAIVWAVTVAGALLLQRDREKFHAEYPSG